MLSYLVKLFISLEGLQHMFLGSPFLILLLQWRVLSLPALAQNSVSLELFNATRLEYNMHGMLILGSWALLNLLVGNFLGIRSRGRLQAFHQMNVYWNLVNLVIAGIGFWQASEVGVVLNFWEVLSAQQSIEKVLLFNTALDLAYLAIGFFLMERGYRLEKDRWIGFGKSIILQGAFLFLFDGILVSFQLNVGAELLEWAASRNSW